MLVQNRCKRRCIMSKFWAKCGKVLTDGTKVVKCNNPPCGYYAVFGIKYRWLNSETMEPSSPCSWSYSVGPYEVINNAIIWNEMYTVCLSVNRTVGECLHTKIRSGCYDMCDQWDEETGECTHSTEYCEFCAEVVVYNLTGCYDKFQDFERVFWTPCGNTPPYPAMWETWYGNKYISSAASTCVQNYWNQYFCERYMLNYSLTIETLGQCWWENAPAEDYVYTTYAYCYGGTCDYESIDPSEDCPEGCTKDMWTDPDHQVSVGGETYTTNSNGSQMLRYYISTGGWYGPRRGVLSRLPMLP